MTLAVLILCREETEDVVKLASTLSTRGFQPLSATPQELAVTCHDGQIDVLYKQKSLDIELVIGWVSLHLRSYGLWLLHAFEKRNIPVINGPTVLTEGQNKFLNSIILNQHRIPHIQTHLVGSLPDLEDAAGKTGFPAVVKPVIGAKGQGVRCIADRDTLINEARPYFDRGLPVCIQRYVQKPGRDIRVRVIDYKAEFAFYRFVGKDGFLTNLSKDGRWEACPLNDRLRTLSEYSARVFEAPIAGVDLIENEENDYKVIEVNTTPAFTYPNDETVASVADLIEREWNSVCNSAVFPSGVHK